MKTIIMNQFLYVLCMIGLICHEASGFSGKNSMKSTVSAMCPQQLEFSATTIPGMEAVLAQEVEQLKDVSSVSISNNRVDFVGTERTGFEALLWLRTSLKLFEKLADSQKDHSIRNPADLYDLVSGLDWTRMIDPTEHTIKCDFSLGHNNPPDLTHSHYSALTMKNAIVDKFRNKLKIRPSIDTENPTLVVYGYMHKGRMWLYRVWSGEQSMHKRGYRKDSIIHKAALRETTAAGIILSSGWNPQKNVEVIIDPLCGSGTVPIEAALIMANTAPGLVRYNTDRKIPCPAQWLDIDEQHWKDSNVDAVAADQRIYLKERLKKPLIFANDINDKALALAKLAAKEAGVLNLISFSQQCVSRLPHPDVYKPLPKTPVKVITNPPWDRRLDDSTKGSWRQLNVFLRKLKGTANILSGDTSLFRYLDSYEDVGKMPMKIGNVDVEARSFAMHSIL